VERYEGGTKHNSAEKVNRRFALNKRRNTKCEQRGDGEPSVVCPAGVTELGALWASEGTQSASSAEMVNRLRFAPQG